MASYTSLLMSCTTVSMLIASSASDGTPQVLDGMCKHEQDRPGIRDQLCLLLHSVPEAVTADAEKATIGKGNICVLAAEGAKKTYRDRLTRVSQGNADHKGHVRHA